MLLLLFIKYIQLWKWHHHWYVRCDRDKILLKEGFSTFYSRPIRTTIRYIFFLFFVKLLLFINVSVILLHFHSLIWLIFSFFFFFIIKTCFFSLFISFAIVCWINSYLVTHYLGFLFGKFSFVQFQSLSSCIFLFLFFWIHFHLFIPENWKFTFIPLLQQSNDDAHAQLVQFKYISCSLSISYFFFFHQ